MKMPQKGRMPGEKNPPGTYYEKVIYKNINVLLAFL